VEVIRWAKGRGVDVTAEVTPHHLILTEDLVSSYDPVYKVNPPLRTREDVEALRAALADGTIDAIATDHAPHPHEDKDCEWAAAAMGMLGLETALGVAIQTMVQSGLLDWRGLADRMSVRPARIGRVATQGHDLVVGAIANIAVIDPDAVRVVSAAELASKSRNTPYAGYELPGRVVHTIYAGTPTVLDGALA
jgi:dihydroorotase